MDLPSTASKAADTADASGPSLLRTWLGVAPLALYAAFHAWVAYPAVYSQAAWAERAVHFRLGVLGWLLVVCLLAAHAVLSARDLLERRRARAGNPAVHDPWLGFQTWMLVLFVGFLIRHVTALGLRKGPADVAARAAYDTLWRTLGTPVELCVYVLGVTALAFHLGLGLARATEPWLRKPRLARYLAGAVAFVLWLSFAQVLGRFATGESLVPGLLVGAPGEPRGVDGSPP